MTRVAIFWHIPWPNAGNVWHLSRGKGNWWTACSERT